MFDFECEEFGKCLTLNFEGLKYGKGLTLNFRSVVKVCCTALEKCGKGLILNMRKGKGFSLN